MTERVNDKLLNFWLDNKYLFGQHTYGAFEDLRDARARIKALEIEIASVRHLEKVLVAREVAANDEQLEAWGDLAHMTLAADKGQETGDLDETAGALAQACEIILGQRVRIGKLEEQLEWAVECQKATLESHERACLEAKDLRSQFEEADSRQVSNLQTSNLETCTCEQCTAGD